MYDIILNIRMRFLASLGMTSTQLHIGGGERRLCRLSPPHSSNTNQNNVIPSEARNPL